MRAEGCEYASAGRDGSSERERGRKRKEGESFTSKAVL